MAQKCSVTKVEGIDFSLSSRRRKAYATYVVTYHKGLDTQPKVTADGDRCKADAVVFWTWSVDHKRYHQYYCEAHTPRFPTTDNGNLQQGKI